jgi:hypothetical protein
MTAASEVIGDAGQLDAALRVANERAGKENVGAHRPRTRVGSKLDADSHAEGNMCGAIASYRFRALKVPPRAPIFCGGAPGTLKLRSDWELSLTSA